ncbi:YhgE/Pip domain-containing protein [Nonomuraea roseoviolacea]|uniref:Membrane protein n=1 Tax=Nonomuraea roseoviolacea subsp. carminata TaxID=160689 RepID=A0ABT1K613_9ACTN|nr:YhgE/Pip domain-containing protein [Nonomuraea roseoviolacea]MCP2349448.1 putative membrane protein [Nonomuraea roseoviolacea subsp. carminata]
MRGMLRSRLPRMALAAVVVLPLLYAGLYLWSFWDPQGNLDRVPVALVMEDRPAMAGNTNLHAGQDLADELRERHVFNWHEATPQQAADGVRDGSYYLSLTIPADFSSRLASPSDDATTPAPAQLGVRVDTGRSYIIGSISDAVFNEVRAAAERTAVHDYFDRVFISIGDIHDKTTEAADGAGKLHDGTVKAGDGVSKLNSGLGTAESGARQLSTGLDTAGSATARLRDGSAKITDGITQAQRGIGALRGGLTKLRAQGTAPLRRGAREAAGKVHAQTRTVDQLADRYVPLLNQYGPEVARAAERVADQADKLQDPEAAELSSAARELAATARKIAQVAPQLGPRVSQVRKQVDQLDAGLAKLAAGAAKIDSSVGKAGQGADKLYQGATRLRSGSAQVTNGLTQLGGGLTRLGDGADRLTNGVDRLHDGAGRVDKGLSKLAEGSKDLASGLGDGAKKIPDYDAQERDARADMMSDPVRLDKDVDNEVPNYGTGFAPFFLPLALWVGAMIAYMVLKPLNQRRLAGTTGAVRIALSGWLPALALGAAQVGVLAAVLRFGLGLQAANWAGVIGLLLLAAAAFLAVVQAVNALIGPPGRVVALALLMLQLTSAAGTYPIETSPGFFQTISPWLPMSWVVAALRRLISGGDPTVVWQACGVLTAFLVLGLALTTLAVERGRTWTLKRLHPELSL